MKFQVHYMDGRESPHADSPLPSLTQQQFAKEADINFLLDRYAKTGTFYSPLDMGQRVPRTPMFEDISELPDITEAYNAVVQAQSIFGALPAKTRLLFGNDCAAFVRFAQDPSNYDKCVEMGVFERSERRDAERPGLPPPASEAARAQMEAGAGVNSPSVGQTQPTPQE